MKRTATMLVIAITLLTAAPAAERPNIVLVMVDDMGFSDLGCYGGEIQTPNLDALAINGVRFDQFYNSGRCCPTRATLMTGLHPHQTGIGHMTLSPGQLPQQRPESYQGFLNSHCVTIAEALGQNGYATMMAGKWHLGMHDQSLWPKQRGFDKYFGTLAGATRFFEPIQPRGMVLGNTWLEGTPDSTTDDAFYTTDAFTDHAIRFVNEHFANARFDVKQVDVKQVDVKQVDVKQGKAKRADQPFFLYLAYTAPHWPLQAFEDDIAKYRGKYKQGWESLRKKRYQRQIEIGLIDKDWAMSEPQPKIPAWNSLSAAKRDEMDLKMAIYAAMIDRVDQNIGKLVASLKAQNKFDNTLLLFLSDNGGCAEGGLLGRGDFLDTRKRNQSAANSYGEAWANASNTPFRLYKHYAHEGGTATPFFMHWPDGIAKQEQWYRDPAQLIDVMPTLLDVSGSNYPDDFAGEAIPGLDGISLRPAFAGQPLKRASPIFIEHENHAFVRDGDWKLVGRGVAGWDTVDPTKWELYNLATDRTELQNMVATRPDKLSELSTKWMAWADRVGVYPKPPPKKKRAAPK